MFVPVCRCTECVCGCIWIYIYNTILVIRVFVSCQWAVQSFDRDQWFECVCVHVVGDVSVITWPAAHETEKREQAMYTVGQCQGYSRDSACTLKENACMRNSMSCSSIPKLFLSFFFSPSIKSSFYYSRKTYFCLLCRCGLVFFYIFFLLLHVDFQPKGDKDTQLHTYSNINSKISLFTLLFFWPVFRLPDILPPGP